VVAIVLTIGIYEITVPSLGGFPFPCLGAEGAVLHVHPYLRLVINGQNVTIPTAIGIRQPQYSGQVATGGLCFEPMHTHDASGIIHIESATMRNFTLGDFFKIWKATYGNVTVEGSSRPIIFNSTDVLGFKNDATHKVLLIVDGKPSTAYEMLQLDYLDYCAFESTPAPPCSPTAGGNPLWNGKSDYPYETGHTILIEYAASP